MFEYLYEWLRNISYYLILVTAVTYVLPTSSYRKYIRFFTGLVLIAMFLIPVMDLMGKKTFPGDEIISGYEAELEQKVQIEVEEIIIGP